MPVLPAAAGMQAASVDAGVQRAVAARQIRIAGQHRAGRPALVAGDAAIEGRGVDALYWSNCRPRRLVAAVPPTAIG